MSKLLDGVFLLLDVRLGLKKLYQLSDTDAFGFLGVLAKSTESEKYVLSHTPEVGYQVVFGDSFSGEGETLGMALHVAFLEMKK